MTFAGDLNYLRQEKETMSPEDWIAEVNEYGPDKDRDEFTPLICACRHGQLEVVKFLIENGADYRKTRRNKHSTGLHFATVYDHIEIVKYWIEQLHHKVVPRDLEYADDVKHIREYLLQHKV